MELQFEIAEEHVKTFVAALTCLSQIGSQVSLECEVVAGGLSGGSQSQSQSQSQQYQLTCRALNDAHSASAQITFERAFFADIRINEAKASLTEIPVAFRPEQLQRWRRVMPSVRCSVYAKACCAVFRTLKHVRSVQLAFSWADEDENSSDRSSASTSRSEDEVDVPCTEVRWCLSCDADITKTHRMKVHGGEVMRAVFDRRNCPSRLRTRNYHLASLLAHIHQTKEVSVTCTPSQVKFESYFPNSADGKVHLQTETAVESADFNEYVLAHNPMSIEETSVQLIFCLSEMRSFLAFCKASDLLEVQFYFSTGGSPVLFLAESTSMARFSIEMTLSTVTTFLPALSQTPSEAEVPPYEHQGSNSMSLTPEESETSQSQPRYLTHSKRTRVD